MTYFSPWFLVGFVLGAIAGTFATDLTREEFRNESFKPTRRFWESRQQSLTITVGVWLILLVTTIIFAGWADLLIGSVIGAAAAPWMWLHFARHFGVEAQLKEAEKKARIEAASYEIYLKEGKPEGRAQAHWDTAKKEVEDTEPRLIEMSGEQELARYRLVSVLLGTALLVATLLPVLKDWLPRAQQFQAFGISLTLATQQANQGRGTPLVPYGSLPNADQGTDRLSEATLAAYKIGAAGRHPPIAGLGRIGPDLSDFVNLSTLDKDRAFIAWLTYELPGNGQLQSSAHSTLLSYIEQAENLLQKNNNPAKWIDPTVDWDFAAGSSLISDCLLDYASEIHDPHLFTVVVGRFLRSFVQEVKNGPSSVQLMIPLSFPGYLGDPLEFPNREAKCDFGSITWGEMDLPHQPPTGASFKISPYPSLIAANYLAAIGAVDTGVLLIEDWIKDFNEKHHKFSPDLEPQLGWYLMRAKLGAGTLPYEFGGLVVPHHQLVRWQADESDQLGRMLRASDPDGWKRLCTKLLPSTLHNNMGQWLAFIYATERFYLFENLTPEDFDPKFNLGLKSLTDYLHEAEIIRDNHACVETVPSYQNARKEYTSYFTLYTAQMRLILLAGEHNADRRKNLIETITHELDEAGHFGSTPKTATLLAASDIWERHRVRLNFLKSQLEEEAKRS